MLVEKNGLFEEIGFGHACWDVMSFTFFVRYIYLIQRNGMNRDRIRARRPELGTKIFVSRRPVGRIQKIIEVLPIYIVNK